MAHQPTSRPPRIRRCRSTPSVRLRQSAQPAIGLPGSGCGFAVAGTVDHDQMHAGRCRGVLAGPPRARPGVALEREHSRAGGIDPHSQNASARPSLKRIDVSRRGVVAIPRTLCAVPRVRTLCLPTAVARRRSSVGGSPLKARPFRSRLEPASIHPTTRYRRQRSGTPFSSCSPASSYTSPEPTVRSHGGRHQHLRGTGPRSDPGTDRYGEPRHVVAVEFGITRRCASRPVSRSPADEPPRRWRPQPVLLCQARRTWRGIRRPSS